MNHRQLVHNYIKQPFPLWECEITQLLVHLKWEKLKTDNLTGIDDYSTERSYLNAEIPIEARYPLHRFNNTIPTYLEIPSFENLGNFYAAHGLEPCTKEELQANNAINKLNSALHVFEPIDQLNKCMSLLVRSIQVLRQSDPKIDISYSHPKIPFSIFVSICEDDSPISNLRVAEGILHEAMHLKLSLIEDIIPLVKPFTGNLYYSPWRDEKRPAQGVLHGAYVFRAIHDYYYHLLDENEVNLSIKSYLENRIEEIEVELDFLMGFEQAKDLTISGTDLVEKLLNYNILE